MINVLIIIMVITTLMLKKINIMILKGIKRHEYDDFEKKFKTNNENR